MLLPSLVTVFATGFDRLLSAGQAKASAPPIVDLGYARYQAYHDLTYGLDVWKGWVLT